MNGGNPIGRDASVDICFQYGGGQPNRSNSKSTTWRSAQTLELGYEIKVVANTRMKFLRPSSSQQPEGQTGQPCP